MAIGGEKQFIGVNNLTGGFAIEDFDTEDKVIFWLFSNEEPDEVRKLSKEEARQALETNLAEYLSL